MKTCGLMFAPSLFASCLCAAGAHAADRYYDLDPATADIDGGTGTWADANWKTSPGGTSGTTWSANDSAFFNPIIGSPATTSITLSGTQTATAVTFNGAGHSLTGGTLSLAGTGASNWIHMNADGAIGSALGHLRFKGAGTATISGGGTITGRGVVGDGGSVLTTVRQTAGTVTISGGEYLMVGGNNVANSQGHYLLEGGALTVGQGIYLGWGAGRSGTFTQTGGTVTTQTDNQGIQLGIGGGTGYYNLNGGTLVSNFGQFGTPYAGVFTFGGGTLRAAFSFNTSRQSTVATAIAAGATSRIDTNNQTVTWSTALTGAAAAGLVKTGDGLLVLSGNNSYAGNTEAARGTIRAGHANAFGNATGTVSASGITSSSGAIDLNGFSFANHIVIGNRSAGPGAAGALQNTNTSAPSVLAGNIALGGENYVGGDGSVTLNGVVSGGLNNVYSLYKQGAGTWKFANTANTFDGFYYQIGGATEVTKLANINEASSLGQPTTATANRFSFGWNGTGGGALRYVGDTASTSDRAFILQGATAAANNLIEANGTSETATLKLTGGLSAGRSGAYTLALGGANTGDNEISGAIGNGSGTVALRKEGAGRWILSGNNTYTGATTVAVGTLRINGTHTGPGLITCSAGATLGGTGTMVNVEIAPDGILAPGIFAGTIRIGTLDLSANSIVNLELGNPSVVGASDQVVVTSYLNDYGGTLNVSGLPGLGTPAPGASWLVIDYSTAMGALNSGTNLALGTNTTGLNLALDVTTNPGQVLLVVVPEPAAGVLFTLALALCRRRFLRP